MSDVRTHETNYGALRIERRTARSTLLDVRGTTNLTFWPLAPLPMGTEIWGSRLYATEWGAAAMELLVPAAFDPDPDTNEIIESRTIEGEWAVVGVKIPPAAAPTQLVGIKVTSVTQQTTPGWGERKRNY